MKPQILVRKTTNFGKVFYSVLNEKNLMWSFHIYSIAPISKPQILVRKPQILVRFFIVFCMKKTLCGASI